MNTPTPSSQRYSAEEVASRGDEIYERARRIVGAEMQVEFEGGDLGVEGCLECRQRVLRVNGIHAASMGGDHRSAAGAKALAPTPRSEPGALVGLVAL